MNRSAARNWILALFWSPRGRTGTDAAARSTPIVSTALNATAETGEEGWDWPDTRCLPPRIDRPGAVSEIAMGVGAPYASYVLGRSADTLLVAHIRMLAGAVPESAFRRLGRGQSCSRAKEAARNAT
jgi:hypothetical protein